jgi:hypothetical protein
MDARRLYSFCPKSVVLSDKTADLEMVMEPIFSMTTLQRNPSEVKRAAKESVVRITEQGAAAYVFCTEEKFEERIAKERADAAYEARVLDAVGRGIADIESGRYVTSVDEAFERAAELRQRYA